MASEFLALVLKVCTLALVPKLAAHILTQFAAWKPFLRELIVSGAHLHCIHTYFHTPLLGLLGSIFKYIDLLEDSEALISQQLPIALSTWLESLQECGVNLEEYGKEEVHLHDQGLVLWVWEIQKGATIIVLNDLTYGPLPSDWKLTWEFRDKETPRIPGGWIEDDDCDDKDRSVEVEYEDS